MSEHIQQHSYGWDDHLKIGASLLVGFLVVFGMIMGVMYVGVTLYKSGQQSARDELVVLLREMKAEQPRQAAVSSPQGTQTAATIHHQPSPHEIVCRTHNGLKYVRNYGAVPGSIEIMCHDGFFEITKGTVK